MPKYTVIPGELKTHHSIISKIKTALLKRDFTLIFIFPTLSLLKAIQEELLRQPDLAGVGGVRLLLFEGFIEELVRRFGLEGRRPSSIEQELLVTEAFFSLSQAGKLGYLNRAPFSTGYRRAILEGIREWKRSGLTPEIFKEWAKEKNAKEQQLALVYETYQELLVERGLNEEDLILSRLEKLRSDARKMPVTSRVIMYGFTDLTPLQNDFLKILEFWFDFEFIIDPTTVLELQQMVSRHFPIALPQPEVIPAKNALESLQGSFGRNKSSPIKLKAEDLSLQLIEAAGSEREITGIAREIAKLISENPGYQWDDFLIITPNLQEFVRVAGPIFTQYQLKIGEGPTRTAREYPAVNVFYEALTAVETDWQWSEMELLIRHFYMGLASSLGDRLLLWIGQHYGRVSSRRRWLDLIADNRFVHSAIEAGFDLAPLNRMIDWLKTIPNRSHLKAYFDLARKWFETQMVSDMKSLPDNPSVLALKFENYQAAQAGILILEEIGRMADGLKCLQGEFSAGEFQELIGYYWESISVSSGSKESSIRALHPREARGLKASVVFIAGLEQGTFPRAYVNDWKLVPADRRELRALGIDLETGEDYQLQEALAFYWSLQTAVDRLYLVYRNQDSGGQPQNRSVFLDEVLQSVPDLEERMIRYGLAPRIFESGKDCHSAIERREWLIGALLRKEAEISSEGMENILELLRVEENRSLAWRLHERRNRGSQIYLGQDRRAVELLNTRFGAEHCFSITAIEDYRSCPYRFFLKHFLKVKPVPKPTLLPELIDLGNFYHGVLREFGKVFRGRSLRQDEMELYQQTIDACLQEASQEWRRWSGSDLADIILALKQEEIRKTLRRWLESEIEWTKATAGRFQMQQFEWSFGMSYDSHPEALVSPYLLEDGPVRIRIWGRVDRVDTDKSGFFTVYDYKLGRGPTYKDLLEMKNLQIPIYILALEQLAFGPGQAVGGSYLELREPSRSGGGIWHQQRLGTVLKSKGLLGEEVWESILEEVKKQLMAAVSGIRSGRIDLTKEDCPEYCEYRSCCRRSEREVEASGLFA